jgi:phage replication-related protein YjqB (UPF0714/DUF867 family)
MQATSECHKHRNWNFPWALGPAHALALLLLGCKPPLPEEAGSEETGGLECEHHVGVTDEVDSRWHVSVSPDIWEAHQLEFGDQVRVRRDATGDEALFTVTHLDRLAPDGTVNTTSEGLERLAAEGPFCGSVTTRLAPADLNRIEAQAHDEFREMLTDPDPNTSALILVPHGGMIEKHTDTIGEWIVAYWPDGTPTYWACHGWHDVLGAFDAWHVSSEWMSRSSFPKLDSIADRAFERVVSVHGHGGLDGECDALPTVALVGGTAPLPLRQLMVDHLNTWFDGEGSAQLRQEGPCSGTASDNIVNRLSACGGVQLELGFDLRDNPELRHEIALAVTEAFAAWDGCK